MLVAGRMDGIGASYSALLPRVYFGAGLFLTSQLFEPTGDPCEASLQQELHPLPVVCCWPAETRHAAPHNRAAAGAGAVLLKRWRLVMALPHLSAMLGRDCCASMNQLVPLSMWLEIHAAAFLVCVCVVLCVHGAWVANMSGRLCGLMGWHAAGTCADS